MRRLFIIVIILLGAYGIHAQCTSTVADPCISVNQSILDRAARAADELLAARTALNKFESERQVSDVAIKAAQTAIDSLNRAIETGKTIQQIQEQVIAMLQSVIKMQNDIITKTEQQVTRKTGWQKFLQTLKEIALIALGVSAGRLAR